MRKNILRFCIVGGATTCIDFIIYILVSKMCSITIAKCVSMFAASLFSYVFNKVWTFENDDKNNGRYIWKFYVTFGVNMSINVSVNALVFGIYHNKIIAFVIATGCATIVNFLLQRLWVFKIKENTKGGKL